jgi:transposase
MGRKVKYTLDFKLHCVLKVIENGHSENSVASYYSIDHKSLNDWVRNYLYNGLEGLKPKKYTNYDPAFKLKVIKTIKAENLSLFEAGLRFGVPSKKTIIDWQRNYAKFGYNGLKLKPRGRPNTMNKSEYKQLKSKKVLTKEEELLLEIERLRCENAYLKKFNALVQEEENKRKKLWHKPL